MNKRERLEKTIAGEPTDRVPVALWRHFPGDDQRAADLARSTVDFQTSYDWDFVKVTPASSFCVTDYGVQDQWEGSLEGTRVYTKRVIDRSLDWTGIRALDPTRGALGRQQDCLRLICDELGEEVPVIQTVFSPLSQAQYLAGRETLIRHMRTQPDRVHSGLSILTETTLRFIDSLKRQPIAGIFYAVQHASYAILSEDEYHLFGLPYDRKVLEALPTKWWLNVLHLHGDLPMFKFLPELKTQVVNWHDQKSEPTLAQGKTLFEGAVCGGLAQWDHVHQGTPNAVREAARSAIHDTNGRRLILSTGCVSLITSPLSNLRAVRDAVEANP
jgi:uroporphyrinogen decarboxylase